MATGKTTNKQYKILVKTGKAENNQTIEIAQGAGDRGQTVRIKAQAGVKYQLQEVGQDKNVAHHQRRAQTDADGRRQRHGGPGHRSLDQHGHDSDRKRSQLRCLQHRHRQQRPTADRPAHADDTAQLNPKGRASGLFLGLSVFVGVHPVGDCVCWRYARNRPQGGLLQNFDQVEYGHTLCDTQIREKT